jgi:hypothetical protein
MVVELLSSSVIIQSFSCLEVLSADKSLNRFSMKTHSLWRSLFQRCSNYLADAEKGSATRPD